MFYYFELKVTLVVPKSRKNDSGDFIFPSEEFFFSLSLQTKLQVFVLFTPFSFVKQTCFGNQCLSEISHEHDWTSRKCPH